MLLRELEQQAAPLVMGAIQVSLATAEGLLERGSLRHVLTPSACQHAVVRAIFDHIVAALSSADETDFDDLLDELEQLAAIAQAQALVQ